MPANAAMMQDPPCDRIVELGAKRHDGADYVNCCFDSPPARSGPTRAADPKVALTVAEARCNDNAATCKKHCDDGDSYACVVLGGMLSDGDTPGVPQDRRRGTAYFRRACRQGNQLGCAIIEDFEGKASRCELVEGCEMPCSAGIWPACVRLADAYMRGVGVRRAPQRAGGASAPWV